MSIVSENKDRLVLKTAVKAALVDLATTQTTDMNTNAKLQLAVKRQADILEKLINFLSI